MKTLRNAALSAALLVSVVGAMTSQHARAQESKQTAYVPFFVGKEMFLRINIAQLMDGRTAGAMNIDGDWITVTSHDDKFLPSPVGDRRVPKDPEINSSLKIMQVYYRPSGDKVLNTFSGHHFTSCLPRPPGLKDDEIRFPQEWNGPGKDQFNKLDTDFIGFKIDPKVECGAAIWMVIVRAPDGMQTKAPKFEHYLIAAGERLKFDLQKARQLLADIRWGLPHNKDQSGAALSDAVTQPFHDAATDCLAKLGVDSAERPKDAGVWKRFQLWFSDKWHGRSDDNQVVVTDPGVVAAMTNVYLEANFLIAELESYNFSGVQPAIDHLTKLADELNRALGFNRQGPGTSKSYYAVMDNASWILGQLADDHPYLGLTAEEKNYVRQMNDLAGEIRQSAQTDGDPTAAEYVRRDFRNAWSGPASETFKHVVTKLMTNRSDDAADLQASLKRLSTALTDKCGDDSRCKGQFEIAGAR